jgi:hypothetical protein
MTIRWRVLATLALVVASVAGCGALGASATPAATSGRTATPAGSYTSSTFDPPVTVTLPEGWVIAGDSAEQFSLQPVESDWVGMHVFRSPLPASQDAACPTEPVAGAGAQRRASWSGSGRGPASS